MPINEEEIDVLTKQAKDMRSKKGKTAQKMLQSIYRELKKERLTMKGASGMVYAIQQCFDDAFVQHLGALSEVEDLFANQQSHQWREAMKDYLEEIITKLPKVIAMIAMTDAPEDSEEYQTLQCLQWSVAKVKVLWSIMSFSSLERLVSWILFMSWSVFDHMVTHLTKILEALQEVSHVQYLSLVFFTMPHLALYHAFQDHSEMCETPCLWLI